MGPGILLGYLIAFFFTGVAVSTGLILWAMGPAARKIMIAYILKKPVLQFPGSDKQWEFVIVDRVTDKGTYIVESDEGEMEYKPDPKDVFYAGNKIPLLTALRNVRLSISPFKAFSAEIKNNADSDDNKGKVEWKGDENVDGKAPFITVCWDDIKEKIKDQFSPSRFAGMWATSINKTKDWEAPKKDKDLLSGNTWKIGGILMAVMVVVVIFYIISNMGWI